MSPRVEVQGPREWEGRGSCGREAGGWGRPPFALAGVVGHIGCSEAVAWCLHLPPGPALWMIALLCTGAPGPFRSPPPHLSTTSVSGVLGQSSAGEEAELGHKIREALIGTGTHRLMSDLDT